MPALAIGEALVARGHQRGDIEFVGSRRGVEAELVPAAGFAITLLPGRGIVRGTVLGNVGAVLGLLTAFARSFSLLLRRRPSVVVSVGGWAGLPCAAAAVACRVPLVLANADAVAGAANRAVARFARASAVAYEGTALPRAVITGTPVRSEVVAVQRGTHARRQARDALGLPPDRLVVAVFGGSLGARRINDAALELAQIWANRDDLAVHHVIGRRDWAELSAAVPSRSVRGLHYQAVEYESRMPSVYAAADVAVCRAGAMTVAELAVVGLPAVLVPLPGSPGDHQGANAEVLVRAGGAVSLADAQCSGERLAETLDPLVRDGARREAMGRRARALGRDDAAQRVADVVEASIRRGR